MVAVISVVVVVMAESKSVSISSSSVRIFRVDFSTLFPQVTISATISAREKNDHTEHGLTSHMHSVLDFFLAIFFANVGTHLYVVCPTVNPTQANQRRSGRRQPSCICWAGNDFQ